MSVIWVAFIPAACCVLFLAWSCLPRKCPACGQRGGMLFWTSSHDVLHNAACTKCDTGFDCDGNDIIGPVGTHAKRRAAAVTEYEHYFGKSPRQRVDVGVEGE